MGSGGGFGFSGAGQVGGAGGPGSFHSYGASQGYAEDWVARTKETLEKELRYRGIEPAIIKEVVDKIEEPSVVQPVIIAILATALVLTFVFWIVWENT
jgi:hypothetical protein